MASKYHPDAGGDIWVFQQVNAAYESVVNQRAKATASSKNTKASNYRSEPEKVKSKQSDPPEADLRGNSKQSMPSNRSRSQPESQNDAKNQRAALESSPSLRQVLFGHLPLQNETSVFILVNVLDIFATYALLRFGGLEANPIANYFYTHWNVKGIVAFKMAMVAIVAIIAQIIARRNLARASQVLILGTAIVTAVVLYSVYLLARKL